MTRKQSALSPEDKAVLETMRTKKLKPGQMLFVGPKSIGVILDKVSFEEAGGYTDMYVIEKNEWNEK